MSKRKTRISDVAAAAGVSVATVDRVLNARGGVRQPVQARVLEAARRLKIDRVLHETPQHWLRLGVLIQHPRIHFYAELDASFQRLMPMLQAQRVGLRIEHLASLEAAAMSQQISAFAAQLDALIVVAYEDPLVRATLRPIAERMPVVSLTSAIDDCGCIAHIGSDNRAGGAVAAELMGRFLGGGGGPVAVLMGLRRFRGQAEREQGFLEVLRRDYPRIEVVATRESGEDPRNTEALTRDVLREQPALRGIYNISVGDEGVARVLAERAVADKPVFIAHDLTPSNRQLLREGSLDVVLDQNPMTLADESVRQVLAHFGRAAAQPVLLQPIHVVLRGNLPSVVAATAWGEERA